MSKMQTIVTIVFCSVRVCLLVTSMSYAEIAEPVKMPVGMWTLGGPLPAQGTVYYVAGPDPSTG